MPRKGIFKADKEKEDAVPVYPGPPKPAAYDKEAALKYVREIIRLCKNGNSGNALGVARKLEEYIDQ